MTYPMTQPMTQPLDQARFQALLPAYVAGDLSAAERIAMAEYISGHPQMNAALVDHERLRAAVASVMTRDMPSVAEGLRAKLKEGFPRSAYRISPWISAIAACLFLAAGVSIGFHLRPNVRTGGAAENGNRFSTVLVSGLTRTHVGCSRLANHENLKAREDAGPLPAALQQFENGHSGVPDFSSFGYKFVGADPCPVPGGLTMHLLYRATGEKLVDTISLFVQMDHDQVTIEGDRLYTAADANSPHPILIWRSGGMVYYLVGDSMDTVEHAEKTVRARGVAMLEFE